jgi:hypothetical protein
MITRYTGFAITIDADLLLGGAVVPLAGKVITAALVRADRAGLAPGSTVVTCTIPQTDVARAHWTAAQSASIAPGLYLVEFRTDDGPYCHNAAQVRLLAGVAS